MAQTTVTIVDGSQDPCGTLNDRTNSNKTLTSKAAAGFAGVVINAGAFDQANWLNSRCLSIKPSAAKTAEKVTIDAPAGYMITSYSIECFTVSPAYCPYYIDTNATFTGSSVPGSKTTYSVSNLTTKSTYFWIYANATTLTNWLGVSSFTVTIEPCIDVTYALYESDGETFVGNTVVQQRKNSAIALPSAISSNTYFNYATAGTIGEENCTIKVTRSLKNSNIVYPLSNLSNNKVYTITCERGSFSTYNGNLASTAKTSLGISAKNFAIINHDENYYLYSVDDAKYVQANGTLNTYPTEATVTIEATTSAPLYRFIYGTNWVNTTEGGTYGLKIDTWRTEDGGNKYYIEDAGEFSNEALEAALAAFADRTPYFEALAAVIATADGMTFGTGLGEYVKASGFDDAYSAATTTYGNGESTQDALTEAGNNLLAAMDACTLNLPNEGFYRIKGKTSGKYLAAGMAANGKFNMTTATDATTIFYYDGTKLTNLSSGMCNGVASDAWAWVLSGGASVVEFQNGKTYGGTYAIHSANIHFYDNGDGSNSADRGGNLTINSSTNARYVNWTLETVSTLPVTISAAGYATLCAPVALTVPGDVKAYAVSSISNKILNLTEISTTIPAGTPVILAGENGEKAVEGVYNFAITTGGSYDGDNELTGTYAAIAAPNGSYILQKQGENVGFYLVDTSVATPNVPGFRAYIPASPSGNVKAFFLNGGDTDAIKSVFSGIAEGKIFDLSGRKVAKMQKGNTYIVNGKKVNVK